MHIDFGKTLTVLSQEKYVQAYKISSITSDSEKAPKNGKRQDKQPKRSQFVPNVLLKQFAKPNEMSFQSRSQSGHLIHSDVYSHAKSRQLWTTPLAEQTN